jgi:hypothetical protein
MTRSIFSFSFLNSIICTHFLYFLEKKKKVKYVHWMKDLKFSLIFLQASTSKLKKNKNIKEGNWLVCEPPSLNVFDFISCWKSHPENKVRNIDYHWIWGGGAKLYPWWRFLTGAGGVAPPARRLRKKTIFLLLTFRPSKLPCNLGTVFVEPSSHKLFRPPFRPKKDHIESQGWPSYI